LLLALPAAVAAAVKIERVSPPPLDLEVTLASGSPAICADGRFVAFQSWDTERAEIYVRDRQTGTTEWVGDGYFPVISADSHVVAFQSGDLLGDIFVRDRQTGTTELVGPGGVEDFEVPRPAISADGHFVAFVSSSTNLVPGDTNGRKDVFVAERQ
jgi:Tol biopolymer transport system component